MLKLGTFFDTETGVEYDLYSMNAQTLKHAVTASYQLSALKIQMFDDDTHAIDDINREIRYSNLVFDKNVGEILNKDTYSPKYALSNEPCHIHLKNTEYYRLGFELLPIAISLPNRDITKLQQLELLDGFKRMFCVEVPDKDIFVKVYDHLPTNKWCNAMLLFNSWKLASHLRLFFDRGFKLGLWRHFGIDVTLEQGLDNNIIELLCTFIGVEPYKVLKDNQHFESDVRLLLDLNETIKNKYVVTRAAQVLGHVRRSEVQRDMAKKLTATDMLKQLQSAAGKKHLTKINSMKVPGHIENYVEKHITLLLIKQIREEYGCDGNVFEHPIFFAKPANVFSSINEAIAYNTRGWSTETIVF